MISKSKIYMLLLTIFLLVFLTSCSGGGSADAANKINYRTGSRALEMRFIDPGTEEFFENDELVVLVEYYNRGTFDITNGMFFVSGYDKTYLPSLLPEPEFINIPGKDEFDPTGDRSQILTIRSRQVRLPSNAEEFDQRLKLTACYDYESHISAELCIDPDPHDRRKTEKSCHMSPVSPGAQGAPIVVTRVTPYVSRNDFRIDIDFTNSGDGDVFARNIELDQCLNLDRYKDLNKLDRIGVTFSGRQMSCTPSNPLRLINGRGKLTCVCEGCINDYLDAYTTQIQIDFAYGYKNQEFKNVRLLKE